MASKDLEPGFGSQGLNIQFSIKPVEVSRQINAWLIEPSKPSDGKEPEWIGSLCVVALQQGQTGVEAVCSELKWLDPSQQDQIKAALRGKNGDSSEVIFKNPRRGAELTPLSLTGLVRELLSVPPES